MKMYEKMIVRMKKINTNDNNSTKYIHVFVFGEDYKVIWVIDNIVNWVKALSRNRSRWKR